jgi:hypothetical protein
MTKKVGDAQIRIKKSIPRTTTMGRRRRAASLQVVVNISTIIVRQRILAHHFDSTTPNLSTVVGRFPPLSVIKNNGALPLSTSWMRAIGRVRSV